MPELKQTILDNKLHDLDSPVTSGQMHICVITIYDEVSHPTEGVYADYEGGRYTVVTSDCLNIDWINAL